MGPPKPTVEPIRGLLRTRQGSPPRLAAKPTINTNVQVSENIQVNAIQRVNIKDVLKILPQPIFLPDFQSQVVKYLPLAGRLKYFVENWKLITLHPWIIDTVTGCKLSFVNYPFQERVLECQCNLFVRLDFRHQPK